MRCTKSTRSLAFFVLVFFGLTNCIVLITLLDHSNTRITIANYAKAGKLFGGALPIPVTVSGNPKNIDNNTIIIPKFMNLPAGIVVTKKRNFVTERQRWINHDVHGVMNSNVKLNNNFGVPVDKYEQVTVMNLETAKNNTSQAKWLLDIYNSIKRNWTFNAKVAEKIRFELDKYCKPSQQFVLTQKIVNLNINGTLTYEGKKKWRTNVTLEEFSRLPKEMPFKKQMFRKCGVVGNSGILLGSKCGKFIDEADFVIRLNMARVCNYTDDVGAKTHLVTCNASQFISNYTRFDDKGKQKYKNELISQFQNATVYTTGFLFRTHRGLTFRAQDIHKSVNSDVLFAYNPYISSVKGFFRRQYHIKEDFVSSGLLLLSAAMSFCEEVHLFGFWPFSEDPDGKPLHYHYYEKYAYMKQVHNMTAEFETLVNLHNKGAIRLHVGKCEN
ncbi:alpha-2,8-sialyltransferase 8E-like [Ptychodera flava]|uniref:alpha-2,8-sialyltransferase 8E-like n=1 Tax=Ptychodera flava TaxID=63121 RepID=UPI003969EE8D